MVWYESKVLFVNDLQISGKSRKPEAVVAVGGAVFYNGPTHH